jgi:hypothetical protein
VGPSTSFGSKSASTYFGNCPGTTHTIKSIQEGDYQSQFVSNPFDKQIIAIYKIAEKNFKDSASSSSSLFHLILDYEDVLAWKTPLQIVPETLMKRVEAAFNYVLTVVEGSLQLNFTTLVDETYEETKVNGKTSKNIKQDEMPIKQLFDNLILTPSGQWLLQHSPRFRTSVIDFYWKQLFCLPWNDSLEIIRFLEFRNNDLTTLIASISKKQVKLFEENHRHKFQKTKQTCERFIYDITQLRMDPKASIEKLPLNKRGDLLHRFNQHNYPSVLHASVHKVLEKTSRKREQIGKLMNGLLIHACSKYCKGKQQLEITAAINQCFANNKIDMANIDGLTKTMGEIVRKKKRRFRLKRA